MNFKKCVSCYHQNMWGFIWALRFPPPNTICICDDSYASNHITALLVPDNEHECSQWRVEVSSYSQKHKNKKC